MKLEERYEPTDSQPVNLDLQSTRVCQRFDGHDVLETVTDSALRLVGFYDARLPFVQIRRRLLASRIGPGGNRPPADSNSALPFPSSIILNDPFPSPLDASAPSPSFASSDLSIHLEEHLHLFLQSGVSEVGVGLGPLHVADLDLGHALAPPLLFQTEPQDGDLPLEDVIAALQPAVHEQICMLTFVNLHPFFISGPFERKGLDQWFSTGGSRPKSVVADPFSVGRGALPGEGNAIKKFFLSERHSYSSTVGGDNAL